MTTNPKAQAAKAALMDAIKAAGGFVSLRMGGTCYMTTANNVAKVHADLTKKAMRSGEGIHLPDGSREWYEWVAVYDPVKGAERESSGYTWKKGDGNLCKHELIKNVVDKANTHTKTVIRTAWKKLNFD